jgi:hypothetical protein
MGFDAGTAWASHLGEGRPDACAGVLTPLTERAAPRGLGGRVQAWY